MILLPNACWLGNVWSIGERNPGVARPAVAVLRQLWLGKRNPTFGRTGGRYHQSHFRSYAELQLEIGHRDATLLRTRYVDQRPVVNAEAFWETRRELAA